MIEVTVPGFRTLRLEHLTLDVNGTLALDGELLAGVAERLGRLRTLLQLHLVTADTHGRQDRLDAELGLTAVRLRPGIREQEQKAELARSLGPEGVVAIGNGANDVLMLKEAALGIAVLGPEGLAVAALQAADIVVADIEAGLDLLLNPARLVATLRR